MASKGRQGPSAATRNGGGGAAAVGIDLGTTYSVVGACRKGKVDIFSNDSGSRTTPSIVGFLDGVQYVGAPAKDLPADSQIFDAKRLIGRPWSDPNIKSDMKFWPFNVVESNGAPRIEVSVDGQIEILAPEQISAMVLKDLKETAEAALAEPVTRAVVTVPAYFNERQRQATKDACKIAGLEVISMINEPTAAAIAYGMGLPDATKKKTVFVFDLGGGTFDVSVMTIEGSYFHVVAHGGDTHLGGQDFDMRLMAHVFKEFHKKRGVDVLASGDKQAMHEVRQACETAKRKLSNVHEATVPVYLARRNITERVTVTRSCFETLCDDLFKKAMAITKSVLIDAKMRRDFIDEVVLVGGSTRIPKVREMLQEVFGGKALRKSIQPDEAVAYGAAMHAAVLTGDPDVKNAVQLRDVTPLSLGIEILGGRYSVIIPKNSPLPCRATERYSSTVDYQAELGSKVYQGERLLVQDNHCLNKEVVVAAPPRPAGEATVDVTFEIDINGLLKVTAVEPTTGARDSVTVTHQEAHLSDKDIQDMIATAQRFRKQDCEARERVEEQLRRKLVL